MNDYGTAAEWTQAAAAALGALFGVGVSIFTIGWRLGRIESSLKVHVKEAVIESEKRVAYKLDETRAAFDETFRGLRQKINDVELFAERRYLVKEDFNSFRNEYQQDINRIFAKLDNIASGRRPT